MSQVRRRWRGGARRRAGSRIGAIGFGLLVLVIGAAGCERIDGVYREVGGDDLIEFKDGSRVYMTTMGVTTVGEYEIDGDRVIIKGAAGSLVLTRQGTRLEGGPFGAAYQKE